MKVHSLAAVLAGSCLAVPAGAQTAAPPGRFEASAGLAWSGGVGFGSSAANENASGGGPYQLFTTSSRLSATVGVQARVGIALSRIWQVDAEGSWLRPDLRTSVSGDVENAAAVTATERITQFTLGGAMVARLTRWRLWRHGTPFVSAGVAYLRELHEGQTLVETGRIYSAGGGATFLWRARPTATLKALGVRADVRAVVRSRGVALDNRSHVAPSAAVSFVARF
jgi:opacity protein-like surface antigen